VHDENAFALGGCSSHAGLFSTAEELFVIAQFLREHYRGERKDFLRPETVRAFWNRQDIVPEATGPWDGTPGQRKDRAPAIISHGKAWAHGVHGNKHLD